MDIADVKKRVKRPERTVRVCLDADLAAEHDEANQQLIAAQQKAIGAGAKMADAAPPADLARKVRDLEDRMEAATAAFRLRSLSGHERDDLLENFPARDGKDELFDVGAGQFRLLAQACVDPAMSEQDALELYDLMGAAEFGKLTVAAWNLCTQGFDIPFSLAASVSLREPAPKSK